MGNERSSRREMKTEETIEVCEYWIHEKAILVDGSSKVCVFKQSLEDKIKTQKLQTLSQNLKLYRHPNILRFVSTWRSNGLLHLATEEVKPLSHVLNDLMPMQLCIGLRSILNAVVFLHQVASATLNNLSIDSIYVNNEGCWKLGRLECMTSSQPSHMGNDHQGFSMLALNILGDVETDGVPGLLEFKDYCTDHVSDAQFLLQLSSHPFFNHEFINIYTFLIELPIKCEEEKSFFFKTLAENLASFPEKLVAKQLSTLLLSRLVLLNDVAQSHLLPKILIGKSDHFESLFSHEILKEYLQPKLLYMFGLRDSQIRLILLRFFPSLCSIFTRQQLELKILPELLTGVKDTNEQLVAATLHSLADLVPVLGASVVVGQHRTKLFADGRPTTNLTKIEEEFVGSSVEIPPVNAYILTERPSPDGGEDFKQSTNVTNENVESTAVSVVIKSEPAVKPVSEPIIVNSVQKTSSKLTLSAPKNSTYSAYQQNDDDLCSLDIKCSRAKKDASFDDIDLMFKDMEPVILQTATININEVSSKVHKNKFEAVDVDFGGVDGWDEDESDFIGTEEEL